ncbi:MAG TPA: hypothetical protein VGM77_06070 [Gemmatimonadales bacterium]
MALARASAQSATPAHPALTQLTGALLHSVQTGMTLGAWRAAHPADSVSLLGDDWDAGVQCANAKQHVLLVGGDTAEMETYFYLPSMPSRLTLPVAVPAGRLRDRCLAGHARISLQDSSGARIQQIRSALESALNAAPTFTGKPSRRSGVDAADSSRAWWFDDSIAAEAAGGSARVGDGADGTITLHGVYVDIVARRAHLQLLEEIWPIASVVDRPEPTDFRDELEAAGAPATVRAIAAFQIAAIGGTAERQLRQVFARLQPESREPRPSTAELTNALAAWMQRTGSLPPPRRSAALFVADAVLDRWMRAALPIVGGELFIDDSGSAARARLEVIGASIALLSDGYKDEVYRYYSYTRNWLEQAYQAAPASRAGEFAFLGLAQAGFRTTPRCVPMLSTVIARGAEYLRHYPRSGISGDVHLLMGEAWSDSLGGEISVEGVAGSDAFRHRRLAEDSLRARAIAEFTIGFRNHPDQASASDAWDGAWRLLAGLPPGREFFFCESE